LAALSFLSSHPTKLMEMFNCLAGSRRPLKISPPLRELQGQSHVKDPLAMTHIYPRNLKMELDTNHPTMKEHLLSSC
jgi:hypothetical protein